MKLYTVTALLLLGTWLAASAAAQYPDPQPPEPSKLNLSRLRWVQYNFVAGRIVASSSYPNGINIVFGPTSAGAGRTERLKLDIGATIEIHFELAGEGEQLVLSLVDNKQFKLRRTRANPPYELKFEQIEAQPLTLEIARGAEIHKLAGESFWHMYLQEPELVRRHLAPLFEILRPGWQLAALGATIEDTLMQNAGRARARDSQRWARWVEQLGSGKFAERQNAERSLYDAGQIVVPFLQNLDRDSLDAEQAARVRSLITSLSVGYEDTADRIAYWLASDEQVWLALMGRDDVAKRRIAAAQLSELLGMPVEFDPAADSAKRAEQIERLRTRVAPPPAKRPPGVEGQNVQE